MKNNVVIISLLIIVLGILAGCKKEPSIVSDEERIDAYGNVIIESVFQDGSKMYFRLISSTTAEVTNRESFYGSDSNEGYQYRGKVVIPSKITHLNNTYDIVAIGEAAFYRCELVESVFIPNSVVEIKNEAFCRCKSMVSCNIPTDLLFIGRSAFQDCIKLEGELVIPSTVDYIQDYTFASCESVTSIIVPSSLSSIGRYAFSYCNSLTSFVLPVALERIETGVFYHSGLTSIVIPRSVISIEEQAFSASNLGSITFEDGSCLQRIGDRAFCCYGILGLVESCPLKTVDLPNSLLSIGDFAFAECKELESITIPESMQYIGKRAFGSCIKLKSVNYNAIDCNIVFDGYTGPGGSFSGRSWLYGCESLTDLSIGNNVQKIPSYAFYGISTLTGTLIMPETLNDIGNGAFAGEHFSSIKFMADEPLIIHSYSNGYNAPVIYPFSCDIVYVPHQSVDIYKERWEHYRDIIVGY